MKISTVLITAAALTLAGSTAASAQSAQVQTANSYGMAGCGLGSMIFGNQPGFIQVLAATTNGTFASQTFGITTGTSNCVDAGDPVVKVSSFVETNRGALAKDMARGTGETVATLTTLAGCSDQRAVGRALQRDFSLVFRSPGATDREISSRVVARLRANPDLECRAL